MRPAHEFLHLMDGRRTIFSIVLHGFYVYEYTKQLQGDKYRLETRANSTSMLNVILHDMNA